MYRLLQLSSVLMALFFLPCAHAHEGHDHLPVSMKKAVEIALATTQDYTRNKPPFDVPQLDQSWRDLPADAARIYENKPGYYLVSVKNSAHSKTLHLRILLDGSVDAANFSGNFSSFAATSSVN